jgi:hypothetical protein
MDGYCIHIKQKDPATGAKTNKNVSSKNYYAYRLMMRRDQDKVILRCHEFCQQFMVEMYGKDRKRTILILAIQSKKAACGRFSKQLLDIGDGKITTDETGCIKLPTDFCTSFIRKMLSLTRYFAMYTDNTQFISGWQKDRF